MEDDIPGWESSSRFPKSSEISAGAYVTVHPDVSRSFMEANGLSGVKVYRALRAGADSVTGDMFIEVTNDAGLTDSYPQDFFVKAPAQKVLAQNVMGLNPADADKAFRIPAGTRIEISEGIPGHMVTEKPDTEAYGRKAFNPNDYRPVSFVMADDKELGDVLSKEERKANWRANMSNLPAYQMAEKLVYGISKEATVSPSFDKDELRFISITPGERYSVVGYADKHFQDGENGVKIINDRGKTEIYRVSLFKM